MADYTDSTPKDIEFEALACLQGELGKLSTEVSTRNRDITERDGMIYDDLLERSIDIPVGHDDTPVNWLRRTVEIHKTQFMGRPFQLLSTYNTQDTSVAQDPERVKIENQKEKAYAEERRNLIDGIIRDNGGHSLFAEGAESASAVGTWVVKTYYDSDEDKFMICPIEAVENCWALWNNNDFRSYDLFAYVYQISPEEATRRYGIEDPATSPMGEPMTMLNVQGIGGTSTSLTANKGRSAPSSGQPMVTVLEATGKIPGYGSEKGKLKKVAPGNENELNILFVGKEMQRLIDDPKKQPKYYIFPNRKIRRRPWGISDISDAAIKINATYIETLSDWRTVQMKVNFPKFRGFNFGPDTQMPKMQNRKIQFLPLSDGQDVQPLNQGDANGLEFQKMLEELKEQFVRETGISRVLFDDPSITLNSNQALLTSMKPTSDIAENKKQLWAPILVDLFTDAIETIAQYRDEVKDLVDGDWSLKVQWPSVMQKEDPVYQQMLLNRWNAGTISLESYLEMQGETKEEIDRMRSEFTDAITTAALGKSLPQLAQYVMGLPGSQEQISGNAPQSATPVQNTPGTGPVSQPGSGAPAVSAQGALNQVAQNAGV